MATDNEKKETKKQQHEKKRAYISQSDIPNFTLDEALRIARALVDNYAGGPATPLQVASALKMTPSSGHFKNLCGSSIAYGFTTGGSAAKEIVVEQLAKRILQPLKEGEDLAAKREAALKPRIIGDFIRRYKDSSLPRRDIALNMLDELGVPKEKVESVYTMILDTAQSVEFIREIKGKQFIDLGAVHEPIKIEEVEKEEEEVTREEHELPSKREELGKGIFIGHGKNKKPLEQLKRILDQFKVPYKIAIDEPNLGRPIGTKVKEIMQSCNCAILIFTADEEFFDKDGNSIWRPSENVVHELGAAGYLYGSRIVILKEESVEFPSNFRDLGYISFTKDQLEAKSMDLIKELVGFGILKIST